MIWSYRWVCDGCGDVKTIFTDIKNFETPDTFPCQRGCAVGVYRRKDLEPEVLSDNE